MNVMQIPPINATLNGIATVLIGTGFIMIKQGKVGAHRRCMLSAVVVSALFLVGYVTYHALRHGHPTPFGGVGFIRTVYFTMLISHVLLAFAIAFLVPPDLHLGSQRRLRPPPGLGPVYISNLVLRFNHRGFGLFFPLPMVAGGGQGERVRREICLP